jgi:septal ring factor EnvC (AmiA/AmiB activator)
MRHQEELEALKLQLETAVVEKDEAQSLEKQMETIGDGVDSIVEEGKLLKQQNEALVRELEEQESREKEIDEEIESSQRELESYRQKVDEWERTKIKWNRRKKELLELIASTEKQVHAGRLESMQEEEEEEDQLNDLYNKYRAARKK